MLEKLKQSDVDKAKPRTKVYRIADGGGLALQVMPKRLGGGKYFVYRYRFMRLQRIMIIDSADVIDLKEARQQWKEHRAIVKSGGDPVKQRQLARLKRSGDELQTFGSVSREWLERAKGTWSASHYARNQSLLDRVLLPELGALPVSQIDLGALLGALRKVEERSPVTARKAKNTASKVLDYAVGSGRATENVARKIVASEHLKAKPQVVHRKGLTLTQLGVALRNMDTSTARQVTKTAVWMLILTGLRDFAVRGARWQEIDLANALWTVDKSRCKGRTGRKKPHVVPLPRQAVEQLAELAKVTDRGPTSFVFPSQSNRKACMSGKTLTAALRSFSGVPDCCAHGMRSTLSGWLYENGYRSEAIEVQLSHEIGTIAKQRDEAVSGADPAVRAAYLQSGFIDMRRTMMQAFADAVVAAKANEPAPPPARNVTRLRANAA